MSRQVRSGVAWSSLAASGEQAASLVVQLVLTRLLVPEDFGLIGMAVVFTALIRVSSELGISAAIVQRREADLHDDHLNAAFWTSVGSGVAAVLFCTMVLGPVAAWFYGEPILRNIVAVISVAILFRALTSIHRGLLIRSLRFRELGLVTLASVAIGGFAAVFLALVGWGVWSIVAKGVITAAVAVPIYHIVIRWRPRLRFSISAFKDIFGFGAFVTGYDVVMHLGKKMDFLLIGKLAGASALGAYALAFLLTNAFRQSLIGIMNRVMYPVYGKLQDTPKRAKAYYLNVIRINTLLAFPLLSLFVAFPGEVVTLIFGGEWAEASFPLRMLALAMMVHTAGGTSASVMRGLGHARLHFHICLTRIMLVSIPLLLIGGWIQGMHGVAVAMVLVQIVTRMIGQHYMKRLIHATEPDVIRAIAPAAIGAALAIGAAMAVRGIAGPPTSVIGLVSVSALVLLPFVVIIYFELRQELAFLRALAVRRTPA